MFRPPAPVQSREDHSITAVRSIQFRKKGWTTEMVVRVRFSDSVVSSVGDAEIVGSAQFQTAIVRSASPDAQPMQWMSLGRFRIEAMGAAGGAMDPGEAELVFSAPVTQGDELVRMISFATEAYAPYGQLRFRAEGQIGPRDQLRWVPPDHGMAQFPARIRLVRLWSASFASSPPRLPQIFKSPDEFGLVTPPPARSGGASK